ncbi:MAG: phosphatidate cytidylyltransferase [Saprospiraceae bacterium]|nr:phosphatidate cytidylyltransferase [Saprospiraceae bacterium]MDW8484452.1 phosphatidate cytidylyltransferase [Saprospiraceae bacterium]
MKQRIVWAIVFAVAMLAGVFGGSLAFYALFAFITAACSWELMGHLFAQETNYRQWRRAIGMLLAVMPFLIFGSKLFGAFQPLEGTLEMSSYFFVASVAENAVPILMTLIMLLFIIFVLFIIELFLASGRPFDHVAHYLLGIVYVGVPFSLLIDIAHWNGNYAPLRVFGLLFLTWTNDTMAYFIGTFIGKTLFFPRISPKKTWEGVLGGIGCTFIVAWLLSRWIKDFTAVEWFLLASCIAVFGTLGDLIESMFKRSIAVKDSGAVLPGHGGWLDRFDSFIFALPFVWLALMIWEG